MKVISLVDVAGSTAEMADQLRSNGGIYPIVIIVFAFFLLLFLYMLKLEVKLSKIEAELKEY